MRKQIVIFLIVATLLLVSCQLVTVQGSGNVIAENRDVKDFDRVNICCGMQVILTQGEEELLVLEADDNLLPEIETTVQGGVLTVRFRTNNLFANFRTSRPVIVKLQMKEIHAIGIAGGASLQATEIASDQIALKFSGGSRGAIGDLQSKSVSLEGSGGGTINVARLSTDALSLHASGGTRITIEGGRAGAQQVKASGGSQYHAEKVESKSATVEAGGGSSIKLWVTDALQAKASGGSHIDYVGNPALDQAHSGGSAIRALQP